MSKLHCFIDRIEASGISKADVARHLGLNYTRFTDFLYGLRQLKPFEFKKVKNYINSLPSKKGRFMYEYRFTPSPVPMICPLCKKEFKPVEGKTTPYFHFTNTSSYANINMCFECADSVMSHIQKINPEIIPGVD